MGRKGKSHTGSLGGERGQSLLHECCGNNFFVGVCARGHGGGEGGRDRGGEVDVVSFSLVIQIISTQCRIFGKKQGGRMTNNLVF